MVDKLPTSANFLKIFSKVWIALLLFTGAAMAGDVHIAQHHYRDVTFGVWGPTVTVTSITHTNGGSFAVTGTWYYALSATNDLGMTGNGPLTNVTVATGEYVRIRWNLVGGASGYRLWRGGTSTNLTNYVVVGVTTQYTDYGTNTWTTGAPSNTINYFPRQTMSTNYNPTNDYDIAVKKTVDDAIGTSLASNYLAKAGDIATGTISGTLFVARQFRTYGNTYGDESVIVFGTNNTAYGPAAFIGSGARNVATSTYAVIVGGSDNYADLVSFVGGGQYNTNKGFYSTIVGGRNNKIIGGSDSSDSSIVGGVENSIFDRYNFLGAGRYNSISGEYSVVAGGFSNAVTKDYAFAGGRQAKATNTGSFVWADSQASDFSSQRDNTFRVRASNGVDFVVSGTNRVTQNGTNNLLIAGDFSGGVSQIAYFGENYPTQALKVYGANATNNVISNSSFTTNDHWSFSGGASWDSLNSRGKFDVLSVGTITYTNTPHLTNFASYVITFTTIGSDTNYNLSYSFGGYSSAVQAVNGTATFTNRVTLQNTTLRFDATTSNNIVWVDDVIINRITNGDVYVANKIIAYDAAFANRPLAGGTNHIAYLSDVNAYSPTALVDSVYVNVSGDTMTGPLRVESNITLGIHDTTGGKSFEIRFAGRNDGLAYNYTNRLYMVNQSGSFEISDLYIGNVTNPTFTAGGKIWHSRNDGANSTLDADLLDGFNNTVFWKNSGATPTGSTSSAINNTIIANGTNIYVCFTNGWLGSGTNWLRISGQTF